MTDLSGADTERSFVIGQRAIELMKAYGSSASPHSYAVWYTYVSGQQPLLNEAVKRLTSEHGNLSDARVEGLYDTYIQGRRFVAETERASTSMLSELEQVMEMLDAALGSTARYGAELQAFSQDIAAPAVNRARLREIVASLVVTTRDVTANNRTLEARMRESRDEIRSLHETLEAVRVESLTDPLTGIGNRKHFEDVLRKTVEQATLTRGSAGLIVLDIDHFKRFNDLYGHLTGDQVLRLVALTMREMVAAACTIARFGGEEFGIVLPGATRDQARALAERIRTGVMGRELVKRSSGESLGRVTVSVGVAIHRGGDTAVSLLERADQCMFAAKHGGRNRVVDDAAEGLTEVA
ncbi:GGDEF domain-containing protein [Methylobacterium isbiliense]|jgi:diguanylate cyclase|uniref:diguanylate cyclase n=1 Tax=Methylobacterium isbiliense TaxID=315478 RepID=A0ABQ4SQ77_9HYPH|nr:GGDEF domain-containing protein [Methylobacterium isbiliense]MDN3627714.1 GGDEF domain-containing protein [Methylobacterium isbiliense]GJE04660.1 Diguanylate cyclase VdcA [Methylobacterium isbiliense]